MAQPQLIMAIGRIERALSRIEQAPRPAAGTGVDPELLSKHEQLKSETRAAIADMDRLLSGQAR
jgi:hypothetical protein